MTHTPTPWTIELDNDDTQRLQWYTVGPARVLAPYDGPGERQAKADAQFIRTACNAHEELVAALKELVAANNAIDRARMPSLREYRPDYTPIYMGIHRAQAILSQVEGS